MEPPPPEPPQTPAGDGPPWGGPHQSDGGEKDGDFRQAGDAESTDLAPSATTWAGRIDTWVRRSPPVTVSLSLHALVLLALAFWVVRAQRPRPIVLDVSFATSSTESPQPGDQTPPVVMVEPEPEPESEPPPAPTTEPVTEDPVPVPDETPAEPVATEGHSPPAAPSVGGLLDGRGDGRRAALVAQFGGTDETEKAVARALEWLKRHQGKDGLWSLTGRYKDGARQENRLAATAMALLALQGAGQTTTSGTYKDVVAKAWEALRRSQLDDGQFDVRPAMPEQQGMYAHAQATIAACELAGMTGDATWRTVAQKAVAFAVDSQAEDGGWRYQPRVPNGDTSMTGWFMMALKSAEMAKLDVPPETFKRVESFLDSVAFENGQRYGYFKYSDKPLIDDTSAVSAEGLLSRQFLGWRHDDERITGGVSRLLSINLPLLVAWNTDVSEAEKKNVMEKKDVYAWYYITQVLHNRGGEDWQRWNMVLREVLPKRQVREKKEAGSWDPALDVWGHAGGRLFMTCLCTYMLEVYYRHLPLYDVEALAAAPAGQAR